MLEAIFNIPTKEVIWGCVHWTETNLAMGLIKDTVSIWASDQLKTNN